MKKLLEEKDKIHIFDFIKRFRSHSDEIKSIEEKLKALIIEKDSALKRLRETREEEKAYTFSLHEKYGKGHFDLTDINYWILE